MGQLLTYLHPPVTQKPGVHPPLGTRGATRPSSVRLPAVGEGFVGPEPELGPKGKKDSVVAGGEAPARARPAASATAGNGNALKYRVAVSSVTAYLKEFLLQVGLPLQGPTLLEHCRLWRSLDMWPQAAHEQFTLREQARLLPRSVLPESSLDPPCWAGLLQFLRNRPIQRCVSSRRQQFDPHVVFVGRRRWGRPSPPNESDFCA